MRLVITSDKYRGEEGSIVRVVDTVMDKDLSVQCREIARGNDEDFYFGKVVFTAMLHALYNIEPSRRTSRSMTNAFGFEIHFAYTLGGLGVDMEFFDQRNGNMVCKCEFKVVHKLFSEDYLTLEFEFTDYYYNNKDVFQRKSRNPIYILYSLVLTIVYIITTDEDFRGCKVADTCIEQFARSVRVYISLF